MSSSLLSRSLFFLVAPLIAVLAMGGVYLAARTALEDYRTNLLSDQLVAAVTRARVTRIPTNLPPAQAQGAVMEALRNYDGMELLAVPSKNPGQASEQAIRSPWGDAVRVFVYPQVKAVRFEAPLQPGACRKILSLYGGDAVSYGLQRVDIRENLSSTLWRLVYEQPKDGKSLKSSAIEASCNNEAGLLVSLTFSL